MESSRNDYLMIVPATNTSGLRSLALHKSGMGVEKSYLSELFQDGIDPFGPFPNDGNHRT
jgi:hypothetical protein